MGKALPTHNYSQSEAWGRVSLTKCGAVLHPHQLLPSPRCKKVRYWDRWGHEAELRKASCGGDRGTVQGSDSYTVLKLSPGEI